MKMYRYYKANKFCAFLMCLVWRQRRWQHPWSLLLRQYGHTSTTSKPVLLWQCFLVSVCVSGCYSCCSFLNVDTSRGAGRGWANFRRACLLIAEHRFFEIVIITIILLSSVALVNSHRQTWRQVVLSVASCISLHRPRHSKTGSLGCQSYLPHKLTNTQYKLSEFNKWLISIGHLFAEVIYKKHGKQHVSCWVCICAGIWGHASAAESSHTRHSGQSRPGVCLPVPSGDAHQVVRSRIEEILQQLLVLARLSHLGCKK